MSDLLQAAAPAAPAPLNPYDFQKPLKGKKCLDMNDAGQTLVGWCQARQPWTA